MAKRTRPKRFTKEERRLFNAAMKLAVVKGELSPHGNYDFASQRCLTAEYRLDDLWLRLVSLVIPETRRSLLVEIIDCSGGAQVRKFEAQIVNHKHGERVIKEELAHTHVDGPWKESVLRHGLRLSLRKRNLLATPPGY